MKRNVNYVSIDMDTKVVTINKQDFINSVVDNKILTDVEMDVDEHNNLILIGNEYILSFTMDKLWLPMDLFNLQPTSIIKYGCKSISDFFHTILKPYVKYWYVSGVKKNRYVLSQYILKEEI